MGGSRTRSRQPLGLQDGALTRDLPGAGNDLARFAETVRIASALGVIIMPDLAGTLAVDAVGIGLAGFGCAEPVVAAFLHVVSELTFILNSARLLPGSGTPA